MFIADLHNDLVQRMMIGEDVSKYTNVGHTDIPRLQESSIDMQVLTIWVSNKSEKYEYFARANNMYDKITDLNQNNQVTIPKSLSEILLGKKNNHLLLPIAMEGGEALENKIDNLYHFIDKGLFYFGPTWNHSLDWVSSGFDEKFNKSKLKTYGLNKFGLEVIKTCEENKVLIDVSHIGERSFWDIAKYSTKPFIASHSSVHKICPHFRNLKDDQLLAIKNNKGLVGLNPYPFFIDPTFKEKEEKFRKIFLVKLQELENQEKDKSTKWIVKQHYLQKKLNDITPSIEVFIDHIEYVVKLIGIDYVGIGSDYDGLDCLPHNWKDCTDHHMIADSLLKRGYSYLDIEKIMGKNILRVLEMINF